MNETHIERTGEQFSEDTVINLYSLLVAIFAVGGMIGGLMAGWWADFFGRYLHPFIEEYNFLVLVHVLFCTSSISFKY